MLYICCTRILYSYLPHLTCICIIICIRCVHMLCILHIWHISHTCIRHNYYVHAAYIISCRIQWHIMSLVYSLYTTSYVLSYTRVLCTYIVGTWCIHVYCVQIYMYLLPCVFYVAHMYGPRMVHTYIVQIACTHKMLHTCFVSICCSMHLLRTYDTIAYVICTYVLHRCIGYHIVCVLYHVLHI